MPAYCLRFAFTMDVKKSVIKGVFSPGRPGFAGRKPVVPRIFFCRLCAYVKQRNGEET